MSYLRDQTDQVAPPQRVWAAVIATDAVDHADRVSVVINGLDGNLRWEDVRWQSRDSFSLPQRGDECVVLLDDNNELWVVAWWPGTANPGLYFGTKVVSAGAADSGGTGYRLLRVVN